MSLQGSWTMTQTWDGIPSYQFAMEIAENGCVSIDGGFVGTALQLGPLTQVSLGIANFNSNKSVSAYNGNIVGDAMGGEVLGVGAEGDCAVIKGVWVAYRTFVEDAPTKAHNVPLKS
ncbi:MAG: hypothetical protein ACI8WB_004610 [Phenylobacterium sp.]|jgi:hypothetical protein